MNVVDILVILFIAASMFFGWRKGLISQLIGLISVVVAFVVAWLLGDSFGRWVLGFINLEKYASGLVSIENNGVAKVVGAMENILGYVILFFLVLIAMKLLARAFRSFNKVSCLGTVNSVGGLVVGLVKGVLTAMILIWALNLLPVPRVVDAIDGSALAPIMLKIAPGVYERVFNPQQYEGIWEAIDKIRQSLNP